MEDWTLEAALDKIQELEALLEERTAEVYKAAEMGELLIKENEELSQEIIELKLSAAKNPDNDDKASERKSSADNARRSIHQMKDTLAKSKRMNSVFEGRKSVNGASNYARDSTTSHDDGFHVNQHRASAVGEQISGNASMKPRKSIADLISSVRDQKKSSIEDELSAALEALESAENQFEEDRNILKSQMKSLQQQLTIANDQHNSLSQELTTVKENQTNIELNYENLKQELLFSKDLARTGLSSCGISIPPSNASIIVPGEFRETIRLLVNTTIDSMHKASIAQDHAQIALKGASSDAQTASNSRVLLEQMAQEATEELTKSAARNQALEQQLEETQRLLAAEHERLLNARRRLVYLAGKADRNDVNMATELALASSESLEDPSGINQQLDNARRALEVAEAQNDVLNSQISEQKEELHLLRHRLAALDPEYAATGKLPQTSRKKSIRFASNDLLSSLGRVNADDKKSAMSLLQQLGHKLNFDDDDDSDSMDSSSSSDSDSDSEDSNIPQSTLVGGVGEEWEAVKKTQEAFNALQKELHERKDRLERAQKEAKAFKVLWADCAAQLDELKQKQRMYESKLEAERLAREAIAKNAFELSEQKKKGGFRSFMFKVKQAISGERKSTSFRVVEACVVDAGIHSQQSAYTDKKSSQVAALQLKLDFADYHDKNSVVSARSSPGLPNLTARSFEHGNDFSWNESRKSTYNNNAQDSKTKENSSIGSRSVAASPEIGARNAMSVPVFPSLKLQSLPNSVDDDPNSLNNLSMLIKSGILPQADVKSLGGLNTSRIHTLLSAVKVNSDINKSNEDVENFSDEDECESEFAIKEMMAKFNSSSAAGSISSSPLLTARRATSRFLVSNPNSPDILPLPDDFLNKKSASIGEFVSIADFMSSARLSVSKSSHQSHKIRSEQRKSKLSTAINSQNNDDDHQTTSKPRQRGVSFSSHVMMKQMDQIGEITKQKMKNAENVLSSTSDSDDSSSDSSSSCSSDNENGNLLKSGFRFGRKSITATQSSVATPDKLNNENKQDTDDGSSSHSSFSSSDDDDQEIKEIVVVNRLEDNCTKDNKNIVPKIDLNEVHDMESNALDGRKIFFTPEEDRKTHIFASTRVKLRHMPVVNMNEEDESADEHVISL